MIDNPDYAALDHLAVAGFVLIVILLITRYLRGFFASIAVLLGAMAGCAVAVAMGEMTFDKVARAPWFGLVTPFAFGPPTFDAVLIGTMTLVMIVVMIESTGMFLALADITGKPLTREALTAGLRVDGLGTLIGGVFNTFPYTSFSQNVGLVGVTGVKSRWVCVAGGAIMVVLGLLPKLAALVESVPLFVLGGAGLVMFGMVVASGIRILSAVDFTGQPPQPLHRGDCRRRRHDPAGSAALDAADGARTAPPPRIGHPPHVPGGRAAEPLFQRRAARGRNAASAGWAAALTPAYAPRQPTARVTWRGEPACARVPVRHGRCPLVRRIHPACGSRRRGRG